MKRLFKSVQKIFSLVLRIKLNNLMNFAQIFEKYQITHLLEFRKVINKEKKILGFSFKFIHSLKVIFTPSKKTFSILYDG